MIFNDDVLAEAWLAEHDPLYEETKREWGVGDAQWPKASYSLKAPQRKTSDAFGQFTLEDRTREPVGTWEVRKGRIRLQPGFDEMAWSPSAADSPFGDPDLFERPSGRRRVDGHNGVTEKAGEAFAPIRKRPSKTMTSYDVYKHVLTFYVILAKSGIDIDEIRPKRGRQTARGRVVVKTVAHALALLHYRHGVPTSTLEIASGRKQQTISHLIRRLAHLYTPPEPEPWASRRFANAKKLANDIEFFQPNRPSGERYWAFQDSTVSRPSSRHDEASFQFSRRQPETQRRAGSDDPALASSALEHLSRINANATSSSLRLMTYKGTAHCDERSRDDSASLANRGLDGVDRHSASEGVPARARD